MTPTVRKFGGSSLATLEDFKKIAQFLKSQAPTDNASLVVVSAMGETTDNLIQMAQKLSSAPQQRELDMLLSAGERISMSLLSIALCEESLPAISFTGSQAGILTSNSHSNAFITNLTPFRITEQLEKKNSVILAGFQGVCPKTKDVTTLGRGGTDTTAVAMAVHYQSNCEIYKDVPGLCTAHPKIVKEAKVHTQLDYNSSIEMSFWGAEILHLRSLLLAKKNKLPLKIGYTKTFKIGTVIMEKPSYEKETPVAVSSQKSIVHLATPSENLNQGLSALLNFLKEKGFNSLKILASAFEKNHSRFMLSGPSEQLVSLKNNLANRPFELLREDLSSVSLTFSSPIGHESYLKANELLQKENILIHKFILSPQSLTFFISPKKRELAIQTLHKLIIENS